MDRNLIIKSLKHCASPDGCATCPQREGGKKCEMNLRVTVALLEELIEELAELREEREARWKGAGMGDYYCSFCQHTISGRTKFCPECGAKMDEWEDAKR